MSWRERNYTTKCNVCGRFCVVYARMQHQILCRSCYDYCYPYEFSSWSTDADGNFTDAYSDEE